MQTSTESATTTITGTVRPSITCVVPAFNEADGIASFLNGLCAHLAGITEHYDVIVVDDGSSDSTGLEVIAASGGLPVRLLSLSRNFGKEAAISAGLDQAGGEVVVIIDADFQQPFATIDEFIRQWQQGYDMVYGLRTNRDTDPPIRRFLSRNFYRLLSRWSSVDIPADAGDFRLLDRRVVTALKDLPERSRFMKGLYNWVGFRSVAVPFVYGERHAGKSKFNFSRLFDLAMTGLTSFSAYPLRLWLGAGALVSSGSLGYAGFIIIRTMRHGSSVPGWASLAVAVTFLGGVQLLSIGILGEYVGRIFTEVKGRPNYVIAERHGFSGEKDKS
ncbi:glycosyltransferase family 2 protein [Luteolibacter sp. GHJ8]|uniref:Glycosyltransferase family 2 protein n=1 Tax=Luteolibacter rhizosphaerae TaxID=2989719 RepID=A0ABT3G5M8_9BACT|nr:glycosyltransferase family 2 protein [Luteolibacter rhizosphaerae]MCW1915171.1 glycosyltransferase family 2 protein [Luteolibacter rhizosphaerae]